MKHLCLVVVFVGLVHGNGSGSQNSCLEKDIEVFGNCYQFNNQRLTYPNAVSYCASQGYTLTRVPDKTTGYYLASQAANEFGSLYGNYWIGLYYKGSSYHWVDGANVDYTNWGNGYPFGRLNNVGARISDAAWVSLSENQQLPFVCSYEKGNGYPTTEEPGTIAPTNCDVRDLHLDGGRCYSFNNNLLNHDDAEAACRAQHKTLAIYDNIEQINFVVSTAVQKLGMTYGSFWIGLSQTPPGKYNKFYWDDRTTNSLNYWSSGYPYEAQSVVLQQVSNGKWITGNANQLARSVCSGTYSQ